MTKTANATPVPAVKLLVGVKETKRDHSALINKIRKITA